MIYADAFMTIYKIRLFGDCQFSFSEEMTFTQEEYRYPIAELKTGKVPANDKMQEHKK